MGGDFFVDRVGGWGDRGKINSARVPKEDSHPPHPPTKAGGEMRCEQKYSVKGKANQRSCTPPQAQVVWGGRGEREREGERGRENPQTLLQSLNDNAVFCWRF